MPFALMDASLLLSQKQMRSRGNFKSEGDPSEEGARLGPLLCRKGWVGWRNVARIK